MAGSAAGWVIVTARTLLLPLDPILIGLAFVLAVAFYTRDRLGPKERAADWQSMPQRTAWMERHEKTLQRIVQFGFALGVALLVLRPAALPPIVAGVGFALSYTVRWLPWRGQRVGWKHLPVMKMPFVAILWTLLTVFAPAAASGVASQRETWLLAAAVCALIMVQILVNDLRDTEGDRVSGTVSLPVLIGPTRAKGVGYALAGVAALIGLTVASLALMGTALYSAFLLWGYRREADARWRPWIEIQGIVAGLLALV